jgi:hypothetical protein
VNKYDGKYDRLKDYLRAQTASRLPMKFSEIEKIVGPPPSLPKSAKSYRAWWSNDPANHVQAHAWLDAGYRTEQVDMNDAKLVFVRESIARGVAEEAKKFKGNTIAEPETGQHPMIGAMKGTFVIEEGWDLTKPALYPEELGAWEAKLDRMADALQEKLSRK